MSIGASVNAMRSPSVLLGCVGASPERHNCLPVAAVADIHARSSHVPRLFAGVQKMIRGCGDRISLTPVFAAILLGTTACHRPSCDTAQLNERTKALVQRMHARNPVPGISVAIVAPGMFPGAVTAVHGVRSLASGDSLTSSDRFLAGSVGKMFFAGLALRDAGNGRLSLDAPVATFLPASGIAAFAWITPRMLLKHTGGIGEYDRPFMDALIREPARERQTNDWLDVIRRHAPVAPIRARSGIAI